MIDVITGASALYNLICMARTNLPEFNSKQKSF